MIPTGLTITLSYHKSAKTCKQSPPSLPSDLLPSEGELVNRAAILHPIHSLKMGKNIANRFKKNICALPTRSYKFLVATD